MNLFAVHADRVCILNAAHEAMAAMFTEAHVGFRCAMHPCLVSAVASATLDFLLFMRRLCPVYAFAARKALAALLTRGIVHSQPRELPRIVEQLRQTGGRRGRCDPRLALHASKPCVISLVPQAAERRRGEAGHTLAGRTPIDSRRVGSDR